MVRYQLLERQIQLLRSEIPNFCWVTFVWLKFIEYHFNPITQKSKKPNRGPQNEEFDCTRSNPKLGFLRLLLRDYSTLRRDENSLNIVFASFHCRKLQAASSRQLEEALRRLDARVERAAGTALQCSEGGLRCGSSHDEKVHSPN